VPHPSFEEPRGVKVAELSRLKDAVPSDVRRKQIPRVSLANEGNGKAPESRIQGEQILSSTDAFVRAE
jgi:hypothetical protein